jgi:hypothetical protein
VCKIVLLNKKGIVPVLLIVGAILFGYHEIFSGANFFVHQDQFLVSNLTYGNSIGNGWRPDYGFGISFFYGDPTWHPWSMLSLWEKITPSRELSYTLSILFLSLLAGISLYFFLKQVAPGAGKSLWLLSPLIVFTSHQAGTHYLRFGSELVGGSLMLILLYHYFNRAKPQHVLLFSAISWFAFSFGSLRNWLFLMSLGAFFGVSYYLYFKPPLKKITINFLLFFVLGLGIAVLLSFSVFYSSLYEGEIIGYVRDKKFLFPDAFNLLPDFKSLIIYLISLLSVEWLYYNFDVPGVGPLYYSFNVVAVFPLILLFFLFRRAKSFWEFSLKSIIIVYLIERLLWIFPIYEKLKKFLGGKIFFLNIFGPSTLFILQLGLIAIFLTYNKKEDLQINSPWYRILQKSVASLLFIFYSGLSLFCLISFMSPELFPAIAKWSIVQFGPDRMREFPKDLLALYAFDRMYILQSTMHWYSLVAFLLNSVLTLFFIKDKWFQAIFASKRTVFASLLLCAGITMSWNVHPLNTEKLIWEKVGPDLPRFEPTDRFYYVRPGQPSFTDVETYNRRIEEAGGREEYHKRRFGYEESAGLRFHRAKSFTQNDVANFTYHIFNGDGVNQLKHLRSVGRGPVISSELLDMGAVNYYYSKREIQNIPENLSLCFKSKRLYIYKNLNAWPYFYLAERLDIKREGEHLENVKRGTAYLAREDCFPLPENEGNSSIELKEFSYGKMVFDFSSKNEELLVVADAWHPFWKAYVGEKNLQIVKANEIFKGVRLPKGKYTLTMEFDTSPYLPGVYITIISWILFLSGWFWVYFRNRHKSLVNVHTH